MDTLKLLESATVGRPLETRTDWCSKKEDAFFVIRFSRY